MGGRVLDRERGKGGNGTKGGGIILVEGARGLMDPPAWVKIAPDELERRGSCLLVECLRLRELS